MEQTAALFHLVNMLHVQTNVILGVFIKFCMLV